MAVTAPEAIDRRTQLLEAATHLIAREGLSALTHRAVEKEAGVPHGSTTYHFGSRYDLITAVIEYMRDRDREITVPIAHQLSLMLADRSKEPDMDFIVGAVIAWVESDPDVQIARHELQLAGARDPELKALMTECANVFWQMIEPIAVAAGSKNSARDARMIGSVLDGLMLDWLTHEGADTAMIADGMKRILDSFSQ